MPNSNEPAPEKQNWFKTLLQKFLSANSVFSKPLVTAIKQIKNQRFLFVIVVIILVVMALTVVYLAKPQVASPFYAALGVILILALVAMGDIFVRALPPDTPGEQISHPSKKRGGITMSTVPQDSEPIKRELEEARRMLGLLKQKRAGIPRHEWPVSLISDIDDKEKLIGDLERQLAECLARSRR